MDLLIDLKLKLRVFLVGFEILAGATGAGQLRETGRQGARTGAGPAVPVPTLCHGADGPRRPFHRQLVLRRLARVLREGRLAHGHRPNLLKVAASRRSSGTTWAKLGLVRFDLVRLGLVRFG